MREFHPNEQDIIKERLATKDGTGLHEMFSDKFLKEVKLYINVSTDDQHRLEVCSDTYTAKQATEEFIDVIDLLIYLDSERLISKYPPPATTLRDFEINQRISIGNSNSQKCSPFLLTRASNYVIDFIKDHDNYTFHAKQHLQLLVERKFISTEQRRHEQTVLAYRISNLILFLTLIASIIISSSSHNTDAIRKDLDSLKFEVSKMKQHMLVDPKFR